MKFRHPLAAALCGVLLSACAIAPDSDPAEPPPKLLSWKDVRRMPSPADAVRSSYGPEPQQFGELRLPPGVPGPFPVMILIHGDCWGANDDYTYMRPLADALSTLGVATWTIEYRRLGANGGWPTTFTDVALAADHLRTLAKDQPLNLKRVVAAGHSAGGQLALWLATRQRIAGDSPLHTDRPLKIHGVIGLGAITDLEAQRAVTKRDCGAAVDALVGGTPDSVGERYKQLSPMALLPLGVPQWFVHGAHDPMASAESVMRYAEAARRKGDRVTLGMTTNAGHYEPVVPASATWMTLQQAVIASLLQ